MKTNIAILRKRGYLSNSDVKLFSQYSKNELIELLDDKLPVNRTGALRMLKSVVDINELDEIILEMLTIEKALYTKLEICNILSNGNELTINKMIQYIGKIGTNQHYAIPNAVSKKKSYPLPRDIIARAMAKMSPRYFSVILENINHQDDLVVAEIIDVVGWMIFYHQELATKETYYVIIETIERYKKNEFMLWKLIICLSSFNQAENLLKQWKCENPVIKLEIQRSISLIQMRKKLNIVRKEE